MACTEFIPGISFNRPTNWQSLLVIRSRQESSVGWEVIAITLKGCYENKKPLRATTFTKWNAHTTPLLKHLNILTVYDINKLLTLCFVYKAVNNLLPRHFNTFVILIYIFISIILDKAPACISHSIALAPEQTPSKY